ncbi:hypothetical protein CROQUDRAFT_135234 [Cronartium quercuum f. sp. fusiforme G11]|uniref:Uncharacterized protein n=1 Tax=Cronartium quercuum f. sp. fusiforme G11 TaxID=708437 RepID=A0A9P6T9W8_9BASI|nr:hypothetical protein CROQUDRAFT_135234 [Cronartium quercuum f. sp. fusiforme G11]
MLEPDSNTAPSTFVEPSSDNEAKLEEGDPDAAIADDQESSADHADNRFLDEDNEELTVSKLLPAEAAQEEADDILPGAEARSLIGTSHPRIEQFETVRTELHYVQAQYLEII